ncbi:VOC family protein [Rathayibacter sp. YIM 133350]|uniref:VOC family protein n=1 Tax=Rathayibacter sp. YIM 133350 TaxID=3131992 RepID=UPI00307FCEC5
MTDTTPVPRTYPEGVPSWVQLDVPNPTEAARFYGTLFGWQVRDPSAGYLFVHVDGADVAGIAPVGGNVEVAWRTYIAADDADLTAERVAEKGGSILRPPENAGPYGRWAVCADRDGTQFRLWQAGTCVGAQYVNAPGGWNFSVLRGRHPEAALAFYRDAFGWEMSTDLGAGMIRLPGYGDHLASTADPGIHERQRFAPPGFADVIAGLEPYDGASVWEVRFSVQDRDATAALAVQAGATELSRDEGEWTKEVRLPDPFGAVFVASQFAPAAQ